MQRRRVLHVLELPRTREGRLQVGRTRRRRGVLPHGAEGGAVGDSPSRTLQLRRVGRRRRTVVVDGGRRRREADFDALVRSALGRPRDELAARGGPSARGASGHEGRTDPHGAGRERVRTPRRRRRVHASAPAGRHRRGLRGSALRVQSAAGHAERIHPRAFPGGELRRRSKAAFRDRPQIPAEGSADVRGVLSRVVRHVGTGAPLREVGPRVLRSDRLDVRQPRQLLALHGARRDELRRMGRLPQSVRPERDKLRLRGADQRERTRQPELREIPRARNAPSQRGRVDTRSAR